MDKKTMGKLMERLKGECVRAYSIAEAYEKGHGFLHANHGMYVVPVRLIIEGLGSEGVNLPKGSGKVLRELGWERSVRRLYENSERKVIISCWVWKE